MKVDGGCHCGTLTFEAEIDKRKSRCAIVPTARPLQARLSG